MRQELYNAFPYPYADEKQIQMCIRDSDKFEECRNKIIATHGEKYADMKPFYTQENVFYLPEESRWKYIIENAKQDDIALKIDTALYTIEKNNPSLKG